MNSSKGFTLIEILVVMIIFAITVSFALFTFGDFGKSRLARSTTEQFQQVILFFREQAVLSAKNYVVKVNKTGYQIFQINEASQLNPITSGRFPEGIFMSPPISIDIQSTGHISPFSLTCGTKTYPKMHQLVGKANGQLTIEPP